MDAPAVFGFLIGVASSAGVSLADGEVDASDGAEDDGDGLGLGSGVGEPFFFLAFPEADGELFGVGLGASDGLGVSDRLGFVVGEAEAFDELLRSSESLSVVDSFGLAVLVRFGEAVGETFGLAEGEGVGEAVDFFDVELVRFFGTGVGWKIFFNLSPKPSSACKRAAPAKANPHIISTIAARLRPLNVMSRVPAGSLCSIGSPRRSSQAGSSR